MMSSNNNPHLPDEKIITRRVPPVQVLVYIMVKTSFKAYREWGFERGLLRELLIAFLLEAVVRRW